MCCAPALSTKDFKIYVFNVGQGDSQLILYPSGYSVLIDLCELGSNTKKNAEYVGQRLYEILGKKELDIVVVTHLHLDHLGMTGVGGIWHLIEQQGYWEDKNENGLCESEEILWNNAGTYSSTAIKWLCYATDKTTKVGKIREKANLCSSIQIKPNDTDSDITIITTDAIGAKDKNGKLITGDHTKENIPPSENDYSIGLRIQYKDFIYGTLGDLDGSYDLSSNNYYYNDIENFIKNRMGEVDIYRADHHGSGHSSNQEFVNVMKPTISIISCGYNNQYSHPDQVVLTRLENISKRVYLTNYCNLANTYKNSDFVDDDILVTVKK